MNTLILLPGEPDALALAPAMEDECRIRTFGSVLALDPVDVAEFVGLDDVLIIAPEGDPATHGEARRVATLVRSDAESVRIVAAPGATIALPDGLDTPGSAMAWLLGLPELGEPAPARPAAPGVRPEHETQAEALLRLAFVASLARTKDGRFFARVPVGEHNEVFELRSKGFKSWIIRAYYEESSRPPSSDALQGVIGVLEARAQFDGGIVDVWVRIAPGENGSVYIDIGDDSWSAVRVSPDGWSIVDSPPVWFRRPAGLRALPIPARGGTIQELRGFLNVRDEDFPLVFAWLTAAMLPRGPFPLLAVSGEQGSAKSTLARLLRMLIDPHASPLRVEPKEPRDLMVGAVNSWVVVIDNVSSIAPWFSDALCRLATGGGFATRQLYTDSDEVFLDAMRPVIMTGIEDVVRRGDLADRAICLHLPTIGEPNRRTERQFWDEFRDLQPRVLGAVLTAIAGGLRMLPSVRLDWLPRMADFARWGEAMCQGLRMEPGAFLTAYERSRRDANETVLEDSLVAQAVRAFMSGRDSWQGTTSELLNELTQAIGNAGADRRWPRTARGLSGHLRRLAPALRTIGLAFTTGKDRERWVRVESVSSGERPSQSPQQTQVPPVGDGLDGCDGHFPIVTGGKVTYL